MFIYEFYRGRTVRFRIVILGCLYSLGIVAATSSAVLFPGTQIPLIAAGIALALGAIVTGMCIASILEPLTRIGGYLKDIAKGDLTNTVRAKRKTEFSDILNTMYDMQQFFKSMLAEIQATSNRIAQAGAQLHSSSSEISSRTDEASDKSVAAASAIDQLSATIHAITDSCEDMKQQATETEKATRDGSEMIENLTQVMREIEAMVSSAMSAVNDLGSNSDKIGAIVVAIGEIADQTNLLALNAAIEAARAGEQGRGFAVVADEVRKLAERTSLATREIQGIISSLQGDVKNVSTVMERSASAVKQGSVDAESSTAAMSVIKSQIGPLLDHVTQVRTASGEQASAAGSINESVHHISEVITSSATVAKDTKSTADQLSRAAENLQALVKQFKV